MLRTNQKTFTIFCVAILSMMFCSPENDLVDVTYSSDYNDLVGLYEEFREFQKPNVINGIPDYSEAAMAEQYRNLKEFQDHLAAMDIREWPISQQVDYHLVRAEMNGLEFDHRVRKPWSHDPGFYLKSASGAGPSYYGGVRISGVPLSADGIEEVRISLQAVPEIYKQAKANLARASGDLALLAIHFLDDEIALYRNIETRLAKYHPDLVPYADRACAAVEDYGKWLEENRSRMTAPAGLGKENYNWWMKNVHLSPFTWDELVVILEKEYERALTSLKLEENKNRNLPPLKLVSSAEEYHRRWREDEQYVRNFLRKNEIFTVPDYLVSYDPGTWWNAPGSTAQQDFFQKCRDSNTLSEQCHNFLGHHFDGLRHQRDDRPIRGQNRLYEIDMIRSEGIAYGLEELMMIAGLLDEIPRAKEINYIAMAFRPVRGLADLRLHSNEFTLKEANQFCYDMTPHHWMIKDGHEVWYEMQTTLRNPGWHMGFISGKYQIMQLLSERAAQLGEDFNLREFMDEFFAAGMIPVSLIRWEMTGYNDEIKKLW